MADEVRVIRIQIDSRGAVDGGRAAYLAEKPNRRAQGGGVDVLRSFVLGGLLLVAMCAAIVLVPIAAEFVSVR